MTLQTPTATQNIQCFVAWGKCYKFHANLCLDYAFRSSSRKRLRASSKEQHSGQEIIQPLPQKWFLPYSSCFNEAENILQRLALPFHLHVHGLLSQSFF